MVRSQIHEDYQALITLKKIGVFNDDEPNPLSYEAKTSYSEDQKEQIVAADVVVASHIVSLSITNDSIKELFDYVIIDEAHHVPANTWQAILKNMCQADSLLVTATPFRLDRKVIKGEYIYTYPLSKAYKDGVFGEIRYNPIEEAPNKDELIALEAERVLFNDRQRGLSHSLMVRTDTKEKAKALEVIYQQKTQLKLKRIDSSMSDRTVKRTIGELRSGTLDGIICVEMLGEGFDFPNLKIAAIHEPHKSLASTLQFIGRFARTNGSNVGEATFIAMNDESLRIENRALFSSDSVWQNMIIDLSESRINSDSDNVEVIKQFEKSEISQESAVSLHNVRPNCHARIYKVSSFNIEKSLPDECEVEDEVYRDYSSKTIVAITQSKASPLWLAGNQLSDIENLLYIVHYQERTALLFIYSQNKSETLYDIIAESFSDNPIKIPRNEMNRVLGGMTDYEFFNTGMQNRYAETGESYRIYAGSNTAASIDETTGKMRSAGHAFCKANGTEGSVTIGYSSGSKIWSSSYLSIPEYLLWCDMNGDKISDSRMIVKTYTNYHLLPLPHKLNRYSGKIKFCFLSDKTYMYPPPVYIVGQSVGMNLITDLDIRITKVTDEFISLEAEIDGVVDKLKCDLNARYSSNTENIQIRDGRNRSSLADYLSIHSLQFKTTDDSIIIGTEVFEGNPEAPVYSAEHIDVVPWHDDGVDVRYEFGVKTDAGISIHEEMKNILENDAKYSHIIYDHASGEIADYIAVESTQNIITVSLLHAKSMIGNTCNSRVADVYEVSQQAIKSTIWVKTKSLLLTRILGRVKSRGTPFYRGDVDSLKQLLRSNKKLEVVIYVVQPAISKTTAMPDKIGEILAAANFYILNSGRVKELRIWGSE
jgi:superfamily II DNA or RNA helicase